MSKPANALGLGKSDTGVLVQGIIDVFWEEDGRLYILDYKTDRVRDSQILVKRYGRQLELYADALEMSCKKKVEKRFIFSFCLGKLIEV